jgi:general secretion pathway protein G
MRREQGFTLIELLIVVAIIGIVAAIAIPNMLNAIDRSKQKRTMADMRSIATALEQYALDNNFYPVQSSQTAFSSSTATLLSPTYSARLIDKDGWSRALQYGTTSNGSDYTLRSLGKDGIKNGNTGTTSSFDCDIIMQVGQFTAWPSGIQS